VNSLKIYTLGLVVLTICIISTIGYFTINTLTVTLHLSVHAEPAHIGVGDPLTLSANATNILGTAIDDATVTATIGEHEIIYFLTQHGQGHYSITIHPPMETSGTYVITVLAHKDGTNRALASTQVNVSS
jgi:hypothetical protein